MKNRDCSWLLVYTRDGHMSVPLMERSSLWSRLIQMNSEEFPGNVTERPSRNSNYCYLG
jgi:hypothetical protein